MNINEGAQNVINRTPLAMYSQPYDLEFFNIPKCAMTTIRIILNLKLKSRNSLPASRKTFCILRNPVDRFVSSYNSIIFHTNDGDAKNREKPWYQEIVDKVNKETNINDKAAVYLNEIQENGFFDSHHFPQAFFISHTLKRKESMLDYAIDFSNLYKDLLRIPSIKKIGLHKKHLNRQRWPELEKENLSLTQVEAVKDLYQQDYELLERWGLGD